MNRLAQRTGSGWHSDDFANGARNVHWIGAASRSILQTHTRYECGIGSRLIFCNAAFQFFGQNVAVDPHFGRVAARLDHADFDIVRHQFISHRFAHRFECKFCRRIMSGGRDYDATKLRRNIEDQAALGLAHGR